VNSHLFYLTNLWFLQGFLTSFLFCIYGQLFILTVGHTANYAVVVAQLHTKGVCHGIHPFIVQLRDEETHKPLPGMCTSESSLFALNIQSWTYHQLGISHFVQSRNAFINNFTSVCLCINCEMAKSGKYSMSSWICHLCSCLFFHAVPS